jgi:WD40 repeat protein
VIRTFSVELTEQNWSDSYKFVVGVNSKLTFSQEDKVLTLVNDYSSLISWNIETGDVVQKIKGQANVSSGVAFSPDGTFFASPLISPDRMRRRMNRSDTLTARYNDSGLIGIWNVGTGVQIDILSTMRTAGTIVLSSDNQFLATINRRGEIELWNLNSKQLVHQWSGSRSVAISPDSRLVAGDVAGDRDRSPGDRGRSIKVWNLSTGKEVLTLQHSPYVNDLAFSPDSKILASASGLEGSIKLWNIQTGEEMITFPSNEVFSVAISPDGNLIASSNFDHTVRVWKMPQSPLSTPEARHF